MDMTHSELVDAPAVDGLTGVATTAALRADIARLENEARSSDDGHGFGLVLVNICGLSAFNQEHGYSAGDDLIAAVAARICQLVAHDGRTYRANEVVSVARTGGGEFVLLVLSRDGKLSQFRRWLRLTLHRQPLHLRGQEHVVHFSSSFRAWNPDVDRDLLWWLQDGHRREVRRDMEIRLASLEGLMAASGHVVAEGIGLWERLQRAEQAARMDPNGSGALSRVGLVEAMGAIRPPYAIAFVDLDRLRDFNAATGNWKAGDAALAALVRILRRVAAGAVVARWGGDEFYLVLPGLDGATARDRLAAALTDCRDGVRVSDLPVTFSAGVAAVAVTDERNALEVAEAAALAAARHLKDSGSRATVLLATPATPATTTAPVESR
jgi:diguanylate cyclase (GGDEF)-like protein